MTDGKIISDQSQVKSTPISAGLTERRKELFLSIIDNDIRCTPICYVLHKNNPKYLDEMLCWLVSNKVTGAKFYTYFTEEMEGSPLKLMAALNARIERTRKIRPLFAGRDF